MEINYSDEKFRKACRLRLNKPNMPDGEFARFMFEAEARGLNPLLGHLWVQERWQKKLNRHTYSFETTIDGLRFIAASTGAYCGSEDADYEYDGDGNLRSARVTVYRHHHGERCPYSARAFFSEYVQRDKDGNIVAMWRTMGHSQLEKCAEAKALRKAFPEMGQIYTSDEMAQSEDPVERQAPPPPKAQYDPEPPSQGEPPGTTEDDAQTARSEFKQFVVDFDIDKDALSKAIAKMIGANSIKEADPFTILTKLKTLREMGKDKAQARVIELTTTQQAAPATAEKPPSAMPSAKAAPNALEALANLGAKLGNVKSIYSYLEEVHGTREVNALTEKTILKLNELPLEKLQEELLQPARSAVPAQQAEELPAEELGITDDDVPF